MVLPAAVQWHSGREGYPCLLITDFKCSSRLRERVLVLESPFKLFNLCSLPKLNSTQKCVWTDGGEVCRVIQFLTVDILSVILWPAYKQLSLFPVLKFPCLKFSFVTALKPQSDSNSLLPALAQCQKHPIHLKSFFREVVSLLPQFYCVLPQMTAQLTEWVCITPWHVLTPDFQGWPCSSRCCKTRSTSVESVGCKNCGVHPLTPRYVKKGLIALEG